MAKICHLIKISHYRFKHWVKALEHEEDDAKIKEIAEKRKKKAL
jgi:hypothetical protein